MRAGEHVEGVAEDNDECKMEENMGGFVDVRHDIGSNAQPGDK
jgi:hypothetical protein